ncbi:MAG: AAA family ATPase [Clostridia bacterium]|nr:AAA family ATPase [Clostridia bacterium]
MAAFYVRICFSSAFAQEMIDNHTSPFSVFKDNVPDSLDYEITTERFTFGIIRADAENADQCKQILKDVWNKAFPGHEDDVILLATPADGSETAELMHTIYKLFYGAVPYQTLVTEITASVPLLRERGALPALWMQNYLFAMDNGCGFTRLLSSFGDYLRRMKVYNDPEDKRTKYIEYKLGKETEHGFTSVDDILSGLPVGSEDQDLGVVGIDISYFLEGSKYDELRAFANRLYNKQREYIFVFRIPFLEKKAMDEVCGIISDVMFLKVLQFPPLHDTALLELMWDELNDMGYRTNSSLFEPFLKKVLREKQDGRFYGFKTAEMIVYEMTLCKAAHDAAEEAAGRIADRSLMLASDIEALNPAEKKKKSGYDELGELIGMEKIAARVREIVAQVKLSISNDKLDRPCIHMRFVGAPGTGKTTVARIIGQIFREEGILRKGAFMEYTARSLCAEYVGQTAVRTASICRDAYGSVLFIDEAYALYDGDHQTNDYGKEALTTLIAEMENHRDDMLVIMAGYTDDMETLMQGNAGLRSRMPYLISFPNYTREQLYQIFMLMVRKHFEYEPELDNEVRSYFNSLSDAYFDSREFANARFVRNLYERTWSKCALRTALDGQQAVKILKKDFIAASGEKEFCEKLEVEKRIGF